MNRAVIANEAVIAQSVSLRSWSDYMNRLLPTASALTAYVPYLNAATATLGPRAVVRGAFGCATAGS